MSRSSIGSIRLRQLGARSGQPCPLHLRRRLHPTFTFVNQDTTAAASASLYFYNDNGTAATLPMNGVSMPSPYSFTIPANGSTTVLLPDPGTSNAPWGWAQLVVTDSGPVNGQLIFRRSGSASAPATETVVPLSGVQTPCIIPLPDTTPVTIIPFDNTTDVHGTAIALANTTSAALTLTFEFDDQAGNVISKHANVSLGAKNHTAWLMTAANEYSETANKVGTMKITGMSYSSDLAVVALLFNTASNTLTTGLPILQQVECAPCRCISAGACASLCTQVLS
jgi:hypothetical protein